MGLLYGITRTVKRALRLWPAWIVTIILLGVVYFIAPQQIGLIAYKAVFVTLGSVIGYWVHVWCYGHINEDETIGPDANSQRWRRTVFMVGGMLALALAA